MHHLCSVYWITLVRIWSKKLHCIRQPRISLTAEKASNDTQLKVTRGGGVFTWERIKGQDVTWHMKKPWYPVRLVIRQCRNPEGQASLSRHVQPKGNPHTALTKQKQNILWPLTMSLSVQWPRLSIPLTEEKPKWSNWNVWHQLTDCHVPSSESFIT